ncbi:Non-specific lipid-transfer protein 2 [Hibiscus syriacus]|uniref:Non-specific lipid-transfer protein 2 n=1 Tax=Hibiscus syriacus TaxID=106335 RepID=A0A6A3CHD6_HIBSY|nr:non-specific lipid-transfer protein 2-like [Hibiscus syriacus]KAE8726718.1 Non-specific lipid-transfer protein 2 [Hibiscus syriacus]
MEKKHAQVLLVSLCVVALVAAVLFSGEIRMAEAVTCDVSELSPCMEAIMSPKPPSKTCCSKLKEQKPCFCQYLKNPTIKMFVDTPKAKGIASSCGVEYPRC